MGAASPAGRRGRRGRSWPSASSSPDSAEKPSAAERAGANAGRLVTASSNRYEYWRVARSSAFEHRR